VYFAGRRDGRRAAAPGRRGTEGKAVLNLGKRAAAAGILFLALAVWPAQAAAEDGEIPDGVPCGGDVRVVTAVLTRVSAATRNVSVDLFPREAAVRPGDGVLWLNTIPGAVVQVLFETPLPFAEKSVTTPPIPARPYASAVVEPGKATLFCFQTSGIFPYRMAIATLDSEIALRGIVVVGQ
jgi:hypothetical protein